jgi:hypothetical protein
LAKDSGFRPYVSTLYAGIDACRTKKIYPKSSAFLGDAIKVSDLKKAWNLK